MSSERGVGGDGRPITNGSSVSRSHSVEATERSPIQTTLFSMRTFPCLPSKPSMRKSSYWPIRPERQPALSAIWCVCELRRSTRRTSRPNIWRAVPRRPFPGRDAGRRGRHILGDLEARLSVAGFGPKEIGQLVIDLERVKNGHSAESVRRHRERIETRIKARKPAIARRTRDDELARESIAAFKKRTGR